MIDTILDALIDSAKAAPFLLLIYFLIEFLENNQKAKYKTVRLLNGKLAPLVAGGVGLIPQCGFPVMATDLYCQNYIKLGTLIAFFVASSDEALPILLTNSQTVSDWHIWVAFAIKLVYAVLIGYALNLSDRRALSAQFDIENETGCCHHHLGNSEHLDDESHPDEEDREGSEQPSQNVSCEFGGNSQTCGVFENDENSADSSSKNVESGAANETCLPETAPECHHKHDHSSERHGKWEKFWHFVKHPLLHTLKIFLYIFVVNAVFGLLLYYADAEQISEFTANLGFFQCFFTAALGLIPNCASSVIITGMYTEGVIGISAMLAGLASNSGIALAILFRQKKWKRNFGIVAILYLAGILLAAISYPFLG